MAAVGVSGQGERYPLVLTPHPVIRLDRCRPGDSGQKGEKRSSHPGSLISAWTHLFFFFKCEFSNWVSKWDIPCDGFQDGVSLPGVRKAHYMSFLYTNGTDYVCFLGWVLTNVIQIMSIEKKKKERKKERLNIILSNSFGKTYRVKKISLISSL